MTVQTYHYPAGKSDRISEYHRMAMAFGAVLEILKQHPEGKDTYTLQDLENEKQYCISKLTEAHNAVEPAAGVLPYVRLQGSTSSAVIKRSDKPFA